jgi:hypothetical protein
MNDNTSIAVDNPSVRANVVDDLWICVRCCKMNMIQDTTTNMNEFNTRFNDKMNALLEDKRETDEFIGGFSQYKWNSITEEEWMKLYELCAQKHVHYMLIDTANQNPDKYVLSPDMMLTPNDKKFRAPLLAQACMTTYERYVFDEQSVEEEEAAEWWRTTGRQELIDRDGLDAVLLHEAHTKERDEAEKLAYHRLCAGERF